MKAEAEDKEKSEAEAKAAEEKAKAEAEAKAAEEKAKAEAEAKAAEEKAKAEAEAKAAEEKAKAEAEAKAKAKAWAEANPTMNGYIEPLGAQATTNATHVLYDSFAGGKKPLGFLVSRRIDLSQWNHAFVTVHGKKHTLEGWTLPIIEVKSIIKKSDNN